MDAIFHAEIRNGGSHSLLLKLCICLAFFMDPVHFQDKFLILLKLLEPAQGQTPCCQDGIMVCFLPKIRIYRLEKCCCFLVP